MTAENPEKPLRMTKLEDAVLLAVAAHAGQKHDFGSPYILHPLRVMQRVLDAGGDEEEAIVAVLHDVIEDTSVSFDDVARQFGSEIALDVQALSRLEDEDYPTFIDRCGVRPRSRRVKIADLSDNLELAKTHPLPEPRCSRFKSRYTAALRKLCMETIELSAAAA